MRLSTALLAAALAAVGMASPWAYPEGQIIEGLEAKNHTNGTRHANSTHHNPHKEPTPIFKQPCDCPKPIVPEDLLTGNEKCEFEYAAAMGCYYRAAGGCPLPTATCA